MKRRSVLNMFYGVKKKAILSSVDDKKDRPSNVKDALVVLKSLFPVEKLDKKLPPIILKHQLYSIMENRTEVDKVLDDLQRKNEIIILKLGITDEEFIVIFLKDYQDYLLERCGNNKTVVHFLNEIIRDCPDISYSRNILFKKYGLKEEAISELVHNGVLTIRDIGCWWLAIPDAGEFVKTLLSGRKALLQSIRRSKFKEMLQSELEQRKLPKIAKLDMLYYIHDIIGADLVKCITTTSGTLLRLQE